MRVSSDNKKIYHLKPSSPGDKDSLGYVPTEYGDAVEIEAYIYPGSGSIQAQQYGLKLSDILNMLYDDEQIIKESDGVCVYVDKDSDPDYTVKSILHFSEHKEIILEKI